MAKTTSALFWIWVVFTQFDTFLWLIISQNVGRKQGCLTTKSLHAVIKEVTKNQDSLQKHYPPYKVPQIFVNVLSGFENIHENLSFVISSAIP
jgi:hypothetical protein